MGRSRSPFNSVGTADMDGGPPVTVPRFPPLPRQRRRGLIAIGLPVVVLGGLVTYETTVQLSGRTPVIVAAHDIPIGQRITKADVTTVRIGAEGTVATIPAGRLDSVIGSVSAIDLRRGQLVPPAAITDRLAPAPGQQLVPIAVKPSRLPARSLQPGDPVQVIAAPDEATVPAKNTQGTTPLSGVVDRVSSAPDSDGLYVVDLLVQATDGPQLAQQAAGGRVVFVLASRGR